ncbi:MAG: ATP-binding protein [Longimicrobiales bacterium]
MLYVRALGLAELNWDGSSLAFSSRKAEALLFYLALTPVEFHSRDQLASLLWPRASDPSLSRHALSQALYVIRRTTNSRVVAVQGRGIKIAVPVESDLCRVTAGIKQRDIEPIRREYGLLLPGLEVADAWPFDNWREAAARRLERGAQRCIRSHLRSLCVEGRWTDVLEIADWWLGFTFDETVSAIAVRALWAMGKRAAARNRFRRHVAGAQRCGGQPDHPMTARLARLIESKPRMPNPLREPASLPFVGRQAETDRLRMEFQRAARGKPAAVLLLGEAGMGKTRLCDRFARWTALQGGKVLHARCSPVQMLTPFAAVADLMEPRDVAARLKQLSPHSRALLNEIVPERSPDTDPNRVNLAAMVDSRLDFLHAFSRYLAAIASDGPLLLVIDDMHWADDSSCAVVEHVIRHAGSLPLLILLSFRNPLDPTLPAARLLAALGGSSAAFQLKTLSKPEVADLLARFQQENQMRLPGATRDDVERCDGIPFYIAETLRRQTRHADEKGGTSLPPELELQPVEPEHLSGLELDLVCTAAAFGKPVAEDLLRSATMADSADFDTSLTGAVNAGTLRRTRLGVTFRHDLVRERIWGTRSALERRRYNQRVASALNYHAPHEVGRIAQHLSEAGDSVAAYRFATKAANRCRQLLALEEAAKYFQLAAENAPNNTEKLTAGLEYAWTLHLLGRSSEARRFFVEARTQIVDASSKNPLGLAIQIGLAETCPESFGIAPRQRLRSLLALLDGIPIGLVTERLRLVGVVLRLAQSYGDPQAVLHCSAIIRDINSLSIPCAQADALRLAAAVMLPLNRRRGLGLARESLAAAGRLDDTFAVYKAAAMLAVAYAYNGRVSTAVRQIETVRAELRQIAETQEGAYGGMQLGFVLLESGDYVATYEFHEELIACARERSAEVLGFAQLNLAFAAFEESHLHQAETIARDVLDNATDPFRRLHARAILGLIACEYGNLGQAEIHASAVRACYGSQISDLAGVDLSCVVGLLARYRAAAGDRDGALKEISKGISKAARRDLPSCWRLVLERERIAYVQTPRNAIAGILKIRRRAEAAGAGLVRKRAERILRELEGG